MSRHMFLPTLHGVFAVLKPKGISSADLCSQIRDVLRKELGQKDLGGLKVGHGGTLDSDATGVVAIGLGSGCHLLPALLHGNKEYLCTGHLGVATDTYDATGSSVETKPYDFVTRRMLEEALENFRGTTLQKPPVYSALKFQGKRLSDLAREGQPLPEVKAREVKVHSLTCTDFKPPHLNLALSCGGGFYVRSLIHDLGQALGTCAHLVELERTKHGPFEVGHALTQDQLSLEIMVMAMEFTKEHFFNDLLTTIRDVRKAKRVRKKSQAAECQDANSPSDTRLSDECTS